MKKTQIQILILIVFGFLSCNETKKTKINNGSSHTVDTIARIDSSANLIENKEIENLKNNINCNITLIELIKSSSLTNPFQDNFTIEFEDITNTEAHIQLYDGSNVVGNLFIDAKNYLLLDLTNDIDMPEKLFFDEKKWNAVIDCYFNKNQKFYSDSHKKSDCNTKELTMDFEQICLIKNSTIEHAYLDLIIKKLVDKSEKLQKKTPLKSETIKINEDSLVSITYTVGENLIRIEMLFAGGITTISFEKIDNNIKRIISSSAD